MYSFQCIKPNEMAYFDSDHFFEIFRQSFGFFSERRNCDGNDYFSVRKVCNVCKTLKSSLHIVEYIIMYRNIFRLKFSFYTTIFLKECGFFNQARYQNDHEFAHWIRMIAALAFVAPIDVVAAFEELVEHPDFPQEAQPIANYFEDAYIGRLNRRGGRQIPLFPIPLWNMHDRTIMGQQRTNNNVEGLNKLAKGFHLTYPNISEFVLRMASRLSGYMWQCKPSECLQIY